MKAKAKDHPLYLHKLCSHWPTCRKKNRTCTVCDKWEYYECAGYEDPGDALLIKGKT